MFAEKESEEFEGDNLRERKVNDVDETIVNHVSTRNQQSKNRNSFFIKPFLGRQLQVFQFREILQVFKLKIDYILLV